MAKQAHPVIDNPEAFRSLLTRLHQTRNWDTPEALAVIEELQERFMGLARKHRISPEDCESVVFEAMAQSSVRNGRDPKAVLITSVATTFRAWQFADERLCSVETARRGGLDLVRTFRFGGQEEAILNYHPAFCVAASFTDHEDASELPTIHQQACNIADLFAANGWQYDQALAAIEVILLRLSDADSRTTAYEALRRDESARTGVDLPKESWTGTLRLLLGWPGKDLAHTRLGHGILWRLGLGETVADLQTDESVVAAIEMIVPHTLGGDSRGR